MLLEPDERSADVADMRSELERMDAAANSVVIVATSGETLVGYVELSGGAFRRNARTAELVIGLAATASAKASARGYSPRRRRGRGGMDCIASS